MRTKKRKKVLDMKVLGFIFVGLCLVALGIISVKLGWFDFITNWFQSFAK